MRRGEIWWAELPGARGSEPSGRRPVLVVQSDAFNASRLNTVVVAALTSNVARGEAPGNLRLTKAMSGLPRESVINVSQLLTIDRVFLRRRVRTLSAEIMGRVDAGLGLVLDL